MTVSFEGLGKAEVYNKTNRLKLGTWDLEIENIFIKETREYGWALIAELKVLNTYGNTAHVVGEKTSVYISLKYPSSYLPAVKSLVVAALGYDIQKQAEEIEKEVSPTLEKFFKEEVIQKGALTGSKIHADVFNGKPNDKGVSYPVYTYSPFKKKA